MFRKLLFVCFILLALASVALVSAQDDDVPTVALIRLGPLPPFQFSQQGTLDVLAAHGYIDGENIHLILGDAAMDVPTANLLIENALDAGADYIITITTPVTQAAVNATLDMDNPPIVLFNTVTEPYAAGIADASCLKPEHVWGSQALPDYASILPLVWEVNPDIERVGWIYSTTEPNGVASTAIAEPIAEEIGLTLIIQSVAETAEVVAAAEAIADEGVDAFFIPTDSTVGNALAAILATAEEEGIPVFFADSLQVFNGATVGAGVSYYQEGVDTGRVLLAHLNNEIDIATTAISKQSGTLIGVNLDTAEGADVEIPQTFLDTADFIIQDGANIGATLSLPDVSMDEMMEMDAAFLEGLACTDELIEEQRAALGEEGD